MRNCMLPSDHGVHMTFPDVASRLLRYPLLTPGSVIAHSGFTATFIRYKRLGAEISVLDSQLWKKIGTLYQ